MAQAGIHGLVGLAVRKYLPDREWMILGIVLGNLFPDSDNLAVAIATVAGLPTTGLHRTFTHSLFTIVLVYGIFYLVAKTTRQSRWSNLGAGIGLGVLLHTLLDILIWFDGVALLWPLPTWFDLWDRVNPPQWFDKLMLPLEFFLFALFFWAVYRLGQKQGIDQKSSKLLMFWMYIQSFLFVLFTILVFTIDKWFMTVYGLFYLLSLGLALWITIRMRNLLNMSASYSMTGLLKT